MNKTLKPSLELTLLDLFFEADKSNIHVVNILGSGRIFVLEVQFLKDM